MSERDKKKEALIFHTGYPVIIKQGDEEPAPEHDLCFIVAANGIFLFKRIGLVEATVKVSGIPTLQKQEAWGELNVSKFPVEELARVINFFRAIYDDMKTEAVVLLFYHPQEKRWRVEVPKQQASSAHVRYDDGIQIDGWLKAGTLHSHCDFGAFHSHGDHADEKHFDGIHMTIGHLTKEHPSLSVEVVVNGQRFTKEPSDYFHGLVMAEVEREERKWQPGTQSTSLHSPSGTTRIVPGVRPPPLLTGRVGPAEPVRPGRQFPKHHQVAPQQPKVVSSTRQPTTYSAGKWVTIVKTVEESVLALPEGMTMESYPFPEEWRKQVSRLVYTSPYSYGAAYSGVYGNAWYLLDDAPMKPGPGIVIDEEDYDEEDDYYDEEFSYWNQCFDWDEPELDCLMLDEDDDLDTLDGVIIEPDECQEVEQKTVSRRRRRRFDK